LALKLRVRIVILPHDLTLRRSQFPFIAGELNAERIPQGTNVAFRLRTSALSPSAACRPSQPGSKTSSNFTKPVCVAELVGLQPSRAGTRTDETRSPAMSRDASATVVCPSHEIG
jgi:hypothetical protein